MLGGALSRHLRPSIQTKLSILVGLIRGNGILHEVGYWIPKIWDPRGLVLEQSEQLGQNCTIGPYSIRPLTSLKAVLIADR